MNSTKKLEMEKTIKHISGGLSELAGLFAADGCLNFDKRYAKDQAILRVIHTYPRIQIHCVSQRIILQMSKMLKRFEIKNFVSVKKSIKDNEVNSYMLQVSGVKMLEKWVEEIGFSNKSHLTRYEIFKKVGFVPSNTSYEQRLRILDGELDPWSFYPKRGL